ncbi:AraC family transcriptional regulator [Bythopirellula polymerisocia]|uniref:HTH-type transcriptional activator RhaS n=1 Tax=Bythopirellula polymerisocia TaxID=2528003 RepID=A0A5C6CUT3_9BACT|nr:AraC family transcriptional regulator [Bythopirellula polymerisocia]TWU28330.1 HTH-type transcriptional activator RhaS [Bythopirellula polymerisocia]
MRTTTPLHPESQNEFFSHLESPGSLMALLDHLPAIYFFAKDHQGCFMHVNRALLDVLGLSEETDVIGKTDYDFFSLEVADRYRHQDQQVMTSGRPLTNHVCGVPDASGILRWYVETKIPLYDRQNRPIGVAGIMHDLEKAGATLAPYQRLSQAITHISNHFAEKITLDSLASLVHLSVSQFNRTFKQLFKITPAQYINRVRINAACSQLRSTSDSIETIASRTGFCDASHFVRQFKKVMNLTPKTYREQWVSTIAATSE